jgi:hypothetical protein
MKDNHLVFNILLIIGFSIFVVFVFVFAQNCRFTSSWQRSFISSIPYEKQKWFEADITGTITGENPRPSMARYLIEQKTLIGKSHKELIEMLGEEKDQEIDGRKTITYELEEIYRSIDPIAIEFLIISFDKDNKVEKAEIQFQKIGGY